MALDLFKDVFDSINNKTAHRLDGNSDARKQFKDLIYVTNLGLAHNADSLFFAVEMNKYPDTPPKMVYDFYYYGLPQKKRFGKWIKPVTDPRLKDVAKYYDVSSTKAKEYMKFLPDTEIERIVTIINN